MAPREYEEKYIKYCSHRLLFHGNPFQVISGEKSQEGFEIGNPVTRNE